MTLRKPICGSAQECQFEVTPRHDSYHVHCTTSGRLFLTTEDGEDSAAGSSQRTYLAESSAEASAERSRRLATLTRNKTKRSVHRRIQESKKKFNSRKHVLEILGGTRLTLHFGYRCFVLLFGLLLNEQRLLRAPHPRMALGAARGIIRMRTPRLMESLYGAQAERLHFNNF